MAVVLLPINLGLSLAIWDVARLSVAGAPAWVPLGVGLAIWAVVYTQLPRPMWLYVLGRGVHNF